MSHDKAVRPVKVTSDGVVVDQAGQYVGIHVVTSSTAGSVVLRDGGASGEVIGDFDTPAQTQPYYIPIPGHIPFDTNLHVALNNVQSATVYWR